MAMSLWEYQALIAGHNKANSNSDEIEALDERELTELETMLDDWALTEL